jgi:hypothetical protein
MGITTEVEEPAVPDIVSTVEKNETLTTKKKPSSDSLREPFEIGACLNVKAFL